MQQKVDVLCIVVSFWCSTSSCAAGLLSMSWFVWIDAFQNANPSKISKSQLEFFQGLIARQVGSRSTRRRLPPTIDCQVRFLSHLSIQSNLNSFQRKIMSITYNPNYPNVSLIHCKTLPLVHKKTTRGWTKDL